jgi:hypothetical protein
MLGRDEPGSDAWDKGINAEVLESVMSKAEVLIDATVYIQDELFIDRIMTAMKSNFNRYTKIINAASREPVADAELEVHNELAEKKQLTLWLHDTKSDNRWKVGEESRELHLKFVVDGEILERTSEEPKRCGDGQCTDRPDHSTVFSLKPPNKYELKQGYGIYKKLLVYQVDAPGVHLDDLEMRRVDNEWMIRIHRKNEVKVDDLTLHGVLSMGYGDIKIASQRDWEFPTNKTLWTSPKECLDDPEWKEKHSPEECAMVRLDKGVLYITHRQKPEIKMPNEHSHRRRRAQYEL